MSVRTGAIAPNINPAHLAPQTDKEAWRMAKNTITIERTDNGYLFTGSLRQPTAVEISNYCHEKRIYIEGVYVTAVRITDTYIPAEEGKTVELIEYGDHCPVCGKEVDLSGESCPVCGRRWDMEV